jgi:hypothetical protein
VTVPGELADQCPAAVRHSVGLNRPGRSGLAGANHAVARGATLRRGLVNVPARFAAPARKPMLHLPAHWPWQTGWKALWDNITGYPTTQPRAT